jgi:hypothetical protein
MAQHSLAATRLGREWFSYKGRRSFLAPPWALRRNAVGVPRCGIRPLSEALSSVSAHESAASDKAFDKASDKGDAKRSTLLRYIANGGRWAVLTPHPGPLPVEGRGRQGSFSHSTAGTASGGLNSSLGTARVQTFAPMIIIDQWPHPWQKSSCAPKNSIPGFALAHRALRFDSDC